MPLIYPDALSALYLKLGAGMFSEVSAHKNDKNL